MFKRCSYLEAQEQPAGAGELRSLCRGTFKSAANLILSKILWAEITHVQLCEPGTSQPRARQGSHPAEAQDGKWMMGTPLSPSSAYVSDPIKDLAYVVPPHCLRIVPCREPGAATLPMPWSHGILAWLGLEGSLKLISMPCRGQVHPPLDLWVGCHTRLLQVPSSWP